jgi:hypothetical protein
MKKRNSHSSLDRQKRIGILSAAATAFPLRRRRCCPGSPPPPLLPRRMASARRRAVAAPLCRGCCCPSLAAPLLPRHGRSPSPPWLSPACLSSPRRCCPSTDAVRCHRRRGSPLPAFPLPLSAVAAAPARTQPAVVVALP